MILKIIDYIEKKRSYLISNQFEKELPNIKDYINNLKHNINTTFINYVEQINPKISIIVPVYNKVKYLPTLILSIEFQSLKEFELIFIDDCSNDKSREIIKYYQKKDKRIKLIENKKNYGSLYSRCRGALKAKGDYIIFVDPDDIVLRDGLLNTYNHMKFYKLDIVQFHSIYSSRGNIYINRRFDIYKDIIYQPILSYIFYFKNNKGNEGNVVLWNKLIKNKIVKRAIRYMGKKFFKNNIIIENDVILLFSIFQCANSYQFIDEIGYYYFLNKDSISKSRYDSRKINKIIYSCFTNIRFLFERTENSYLDKYFCIFKIEQFYHRQIKSLDRKSVV